MSKIRNYRAAEASQHLSVDVIDDISVHNENFQNDMLSCPEVNIPVSSCIKMRFDQEFSLEQRQEESRRIREKYQDRM